MLASSVFRVSRGVSVVVSTVTLIVFSYLVNNEDIPNTWRFQWL